MGSRRPTTFKAEEIEGESPHPGFRSILVSGEKMSCNGPGWLFADPDDPTKLVDANGKQWQATTNGLAIWFEPHGTKHDEAEDEVVTA